MLCRVFCKHKCLLACPAAWHQIHGTVTMRTVIKFQILQLSILLKDAKEQSQMMADIQRHRQQRALMGVEPDSQSRHAS